MAIVDARHLLQHAAAAGYRIPTVTIRSLEGAVEALGMADRIGSPVALSISEERLSLPADVLMPAIEVAAERAVVPVLLRWEDVTSEEVLSRAIRLGCNVLVLAAGRAQADDLELLATACGAISVRADSAAFVDAPASGRGAVEAFVQESQAVRQAATDLDGIRRWQPVEHVVMFNAPDLDEAGIREMFERGAKKLGAIPGVREVRVGRTVKLGARYGLCWFVRFASEAVVESYRHHPMHVDFADNHFRPFASDRLTTDFLIG